MELAQKLAQLPFPSGARARIAPDDIHDATNVVSTRNEDQIRSSRNAELEIDRMRACISEDR